LYGGEASGVAEAIGQQPAGMAGFGQFTMLNKINMKQNPSCYSGSLSGNQSETPLNNRA
jgi:hypothetical protein